MNKSKIEWYDYTWNPITGCLHGCSYCYARRFAERGLGEYGKHPKGDRFLSCFHPERIYEPQKLRKPARIFVCSMADLFGSWVPEEWSDSVLRQVAYSVEHTFIFLTKNSSIMAQKSRAFAHLENAWWGASVTCEDPEDLPAALRNLERIQSGVRFISFEPLLGIPRLKDNAAKVLDWIIIGAQTGPCAVQPSYDRISSIVRFAEYHDIPVFIKNNIVEWPLMRQEFPWITQ